MGSLLFLYSIFFAKILGGLVSSFDNSCSSMFEYEINTRKSNRRLRSFRDLKNSTIVDETVFVLEESNEKIVGGNDVSDNSWPG
jgi:hypothetical protein